MVEMRAILGHSSIRRSQDIKIDSSAFTALLTWSKTIGKDKSLHYRPIIIDAASFLYSKEWISTGWCLLSEAAPFERITHFRHHQRTITVWCAPNYGTQLRTRCRTGSCRRCIGGSRIFCHPVTQYCTPHSSRSFLPSATLLLDFPKNQRDCSGGWNAQASDRYARTSRRIITNMQRAVTRAIHS